MNIDCIIEIPKDSIYKYEIDKNTKTLVVDRLLNRPIPFNYGYIPHTLSEDGDPLDVFVLGYHPIVPKAKVNITIVGGFKCIDNGKVDDKLIAIISGDERNYEVQYYSGAENAIETYLRNYKTGMDVLSYVQTTAAEEILARAEEDYDRALQRKASRR